MDGRPRTLLIVVGLFVVLLAVQFHVNAFRGERGYYSDDAAHFMNGLLIRDYLRTGLGQNPYTFAQDYYGHYPKIAPLMWPPFFHTVEGIALIPGFSPNVTVMLVLAFAATWTAWRIYHMTRMVVGRLSGVAAAAIFITTPVVVALSSAVMVDLFIAAPAIEAAYWLARFAQSKSRLHAALMGVFTAIACITKGNGVAVVLMPLVMIAITGQWGWLRRAGLYVAAAIVLIFAAPILAVSFRFDAAIGDFAPITLPMLRSRIWLYTVHIWQQLGAIPAALSVVGSLGTIIRARRIRDYTAPAFAEAMLSLAVATLLFHYFSPHELSDTRYVTMAIGPLLGLTFIGLSDLVALLRQTSWQRPLRLGLAAAVGITSIAARPALLTRKPIGYREVISRLSAQTSLAGMRLAVFGDELSEGAFVSEVAVLAIQPAPTVIRGSKLLASDDWMGHDLKLKFASSAEVMKELEDLHVAYFLVDRSPISLRVPYFGQVLDLIDTNRDRLELVEQIDVDADKGPTRPLALYRLRFQSPGPPKVLEIQLKYSLGTVLRR